jgi:hypothetical protein
MRTPRGGVAALAALSALALSFSPSAALARPASVPFSSTQQAESAVALQWYDITNQTVGAAAFPEAATQSRTWAVSWIAAARAVGLHSSDADYAVPAFAQALHDTLVAQVPSQQSSLDADLASTLASIPDGPDKRAGIASGSKQAASELAARQGDGLDTASLDVPYTPPPAGPGVWQPTPPTYGPAIRAGEGKARPFLLAAANQFDPGPPPSLTSPEYLNALAEVRAYGSADSTVRTPAETQIATFWYPALNFAYVQILRDLLADTSHPLIWQAALVGAFHAVTTDAQIAVYNAKFEYAFWRPVTAIQEGSPGVTPDPSWLPQSVTPRYPEYVSGHGGYAGSAQAVLTAFVGPNAPAPVSLTSPNDPGVTLTYTNWASITQDVINARVWEGVHFRFSDVLGTHLGEQVGGYDLAHLYELAR